MRPVAKRLQWLDGNIASLHERIRRLAIESECEKLIAVSRRPPASSTNRYPSCCAHVALLNPNTSVATTASMVGIANGTARSMGLSGSMKFHGITAPYGKAVLADPAALAVGSDAVNSLAPSLYKFDAVIVGAFGDPGRARLSAALAPWNIPVVGIGQASMAQAASCSGGCFAVVQTIAALDSSIAALARSYGHSDALVAVRSPRVEDVTALMADALATESILADLIRSAIEFDGARAVVIGGGPLAQAARALAGRFRGTCTIIEPIPEAVACVARQLELVAGPGDLHRRPPGPSAAHPDPHGPCAMQPSACASWRTIESVTGPDGLRWPENPS